MTITIDAAPATEPTARVALEWPRLEIVPVATERALIPLLFRARKERGMLSAHPAWRRRMVDAAYTRLGVPIEMALSLRRHLVQLRQRGVPNYLLGLGTDAQRKEEADASERALATHLAAHGVEATEEAAQTAHNRATYGRSRPTPDFLLATPITIRG